MSLVRTRYRLENGIRLGNGQWISKSYVMVGFFFEFLFIIMSDDIKSWL